mgnify:CR=1 FL=1
MTQRLRGWLTAGGLALALAPAAPPPRAMAQEVVEPPMSTRMLMEFHAQPAAPVDLAAVSMSTRLLSAFHSPPAAVPGGFGAPYASFFPNVPAWWTPTPVVPSLVPGAVTPLPAPASAGWPASPGSP